MPETEPTPEPEVTEPEATGPEVTEPEVTDPEVTGPEVTDPAPGPENKAPFDHRLFFLLQRAAHQLRTTADRRCVAAAGVTTAQLGTLFAVRDQPGITQRELARTLGLRESAVTGLVTRLTTADLVTKRAHPREHRAVTLELTEAGAAALRAAQPEIDRFNGELRALLGDDEFVRTSAALGRLAHWEP